VGRQQAHDAARLATDGTGPEAKTCKQSALCYLHILTFASVDKHITFFLEKHN
jgi:hypothetical protein